MIRLLEIFVALIIVFVLAVVFAIALPEPSPYRALDRWSVRRCGRFTTCSMASALIRRGRRCAPTIRACSFDYYGPGAGSGAKVNWVSADPRIGNGSYHRSFPIRSQDKQVTLGDREQLARHEQDTTPSTSIRPRTARPSRSRWATTSTTAGICSGATAGMYLEGDPATQIQLQLTELQKLLATIPERRLQGSDRFELKDVAAQPILFVSTTAKRTLDDVADATDKAMTADPGGRSRRTTSTSPVRASPITTNWGDENYEFDIALPVDRNDGHA